MHTLETQRAEPLTITIETLTRYPVKGLSGQVLDTVELNAGHGFPCDRKFGFARPDSGFNPSNPKPLPKTKFYMLARDASLALLDTAFNEDTGELSMVGPGASGQFDITTSDGKSAASEFLGSYLSLPNGEMPQLYEASPHRFTDVSVVSREMMNAVSLINLDSVNEFSKAVDHHVDPRRFRGNIHLSGLKPFEELDMVGKVLTIDTVQLKIVKRTKRCPATEVDLTTGERNLKTPKLLQTHYGHMDMGVYAEVVKGGRLSVGDKVVAA